MSNEDPDLDDPGNPNVKQMRDHIKQLEADAKANREAAEKAVGLERRLAFAEAGLADNPMRDYFVRGYEGDTSPDAIRAAAIAAGLPLLGQATTVATPDRSADVAAHTAMNQAAQGGTTEGDKTTAYLKALDACNGDAEKIKAVCREFGVPVSEDFQ